MKTSNVSRLSLVPTLILVSGAILGNGLLGAAVHGAALPLFMDSWFTLVTVAWVGGPWGLVVALGTNGVLAAAGVVPFPFVLCHLVTVLGAWWILGPGPRPSLPRFLAVGLWAALTNGILGSVLSYVLYHGATAKSIDDLILGLLLSGQDLLGSVFGAGLVSNLVDKLLCSGLAWVVVQRMSPNFLARAKSS